MGWAWRIATVASIPIYVHSTFAVLIVILLVSGLVGGRGLVTAVSGVLFIMAIFATIVLHELGHAVTFKAVRRLTSNVAFNVAYTLLKSKDDASSPGATASSRTYPRMFATSFLLRTRCRVPITVISLSGAARMSSRSTAVLADGTRRCSAIGG